MRKILLYTLPCKCCYYIYFILTIYEFCFLFLQINADNYDNDRNCQGNSLIIHDGEISSFFLTIFSACMKCQIGYYTVKNVYKFTAKICGNLAASILLKDLTVLTGVTLH